jgi:L,D-transpeptidase ErfK/SrfK
MRALVVTALAISLISTVSRAEPENYRDKATSVVERMQLRPPHASLYEEYGDIVETFSTAEDLFDRKRIEEAEKLYRLTLIKHSQYEQRLHAVEQEQGEAPAGDHPLPVLGGEKREEGGTPDVPAGGDDLTEETAPAPSAMIVVRKTVHTVRKGETLRTVGARFGVNWQTVARDNGIDSQKGLKPGQKLQINTTRIVPKTMVEGILINIPERTLYLFKGRKLEKTLPVGLGMGKSRQASVWQTPTGKFRIVSKIKDPTWFVPPSIQAEMRKQGKTVKSVVPPGGRNPLGRYALKTSMSGILIHGTIAPNSVYGFNSHGCIRVLPGNMQEIYKDIQVNTNGEIIYQPVKLAVSDDGRIFIEVHGDVYDRLGNLEEVAKGLIIKYNAQQKVDWEKVRATVRNKSGFPEDVTVREPPETRRTGDKQAEAEAPARQQTPRDS